MARLRQHFWGWLALLLGAISLWLDPMRNGIDGVAAVTLGLLLIGLLITVFRR